MFTFAKTWSWFIWLFVAFGLAIATGWFFIGNSRAFGSEAPIQGRIATASEIGSTIGIASIDMSIGDKLIQPAIAGNGHLPIIKIALINKNLIRPSIAGKDPMPAISIRELYGNLIRPITPLKGIMC